MLRCVVAQVAFKSEYLQLFQAQQVTASELLVAKEALAEAKLVRREEGRRGGAVGGEGAASGRLVVKEALAEAKLEQSAYVASMPVDSVSVSDM